MTRDAAQAARQVLQIRYWQHLINELLKRPGRFRIPMHCAFGHEALAVATQMAMREGDRLLLTHRNMAYHFAHAGAFEPVLLEYELSAAGLGAGYQQHSHSRKTSENRVQRGIMASDSSAAAGAARTP